MTDKLKALVEAAWAVCASGQHSNLCRAGMWHRGCICPHTQVASLRAALEAFDAEPKDRPASFDGETLPLPTGPRPSPDRLDWLMSGMAKVGRKTVDIHVFDELRAEVNALRAEAKARVDATPEVVTRPARNPACANCRYALTTCADWGRKCQPIAAVRAARGES